ncbi:hypothetical protein MIR68_004070 [Amoeboaphelidium protococcarum]|nr:hypothetical protein MIR68_004070 [Amoeboaphelidium protococcarum]
MLLHFAILVAVPFVACGTSAPNSNAAQDLTYPPVDGHFKGLEQFRVDQNPEYLLELIEYSGGSDSVQEICSDNWRSLLKNNVDGTWQLRPFQGMTLQCMLAILYNNPDIKSLAYIVTPPKKDTSRYEHFGYDVGFPIALLADIIAAQGINTVVISFPPLNRGVISQGYPNQEDVSRSLMSILSKPSLQAMRLDMRPYAAKIGARLITQMVAPFKSTSEGLQSKLQNLHLVTRDILNSFEVLCITSLQQAELSISFSHKNIKPNIRYLDSCGKTSALRNLGLEIRFQPDSMGWYGSVVTKAMRFRHLESMQMKFSKCSLSQGDCTFNVDSFLNEVLGLLRSHDRRIELKILVQKSININYAGINQKSMNIEFGDNKHIQFTKLDSNNNYSGFSIALSQSPGRKYWIH